MSEVECSTNELTNQLEVATISTNVFRLLSLADVPSFGMVSKKTQDAFQTALSDHEKAETVYLQKVLAASKRPEASGEGKFSYYSPSLIGSEGYTQVLDYLVKWPAESKTQPHPQNQPNTSQDQFQLPDKHPENKANGKSKETSTSQYRKVPIEFLIDQNPYERMYYHGLEEPSTSMLDSAIKNGQVAFLQFVHERYNLSTYYKIGGRLAVKDGHLPVLQWFRSIGGYEPFDGIIYRFIVEGFEAALRYGHLDIVKFFSEIYEPGTRVSFGGVPASRHSGPFGSFDVDTVRKDTIGPIYKFLFEKYKINSNFTLTILQGCWIYRNLLQSECFDVFKWVISKIIPLFTGRLHNDYTERILHSAWGFGEILEWLIQIPAFSSVQQPRGPMYIDNYCYGLYNIERARLSDPSMRKELVGTAINWGLSHFTPPKNKVYVRDLYETYKDPDVTSAMALDKIQQLCEEFKLTKKDITKSYPDYNQELNNNLFIIAYQGRLDYLRWFHEHFELTKKDIAVAKFKMLRNAAMQGHLETVKWLFETFNIDRADIKDYLSLFKNVAHQGQTEVFKYLDEKYGLSILEIVANEDSLIRAPTERGHLGIFLYLHHKHNLLRPNLVKSLDHVFEFAIICNNVEIMELIYNNGNNLVDPDDPTKIVNVKIDISSASKFRRLQSFFCTGQVGVEEGEKHRERHVSVEWMLNHMVVNKKLLNHITNVIEMVPFSPRTMSMPPSIIKLVKIYGKYIRNIKKTVQFKTRSYYTMLMEAVFNKLKSLRESGYPYEAKSLYWYYGLQSEDIPQQYADEIDFLTKESWEWYV